MRTRRPADAVVDVTATDDTPIKLKLEGFEVPNNQRRWQERNVIRIQDGLTRNGRIMMRGGAVLCLERRTGSRGYLLTASN